MNRRRLLSLLAGGTAGCVGRDATPSATASEPPDTPVRTETPDTDTTPTRTPSATPSPATATTLASNEPFRTEDGWVVRLAGLRAKRGILRRQDGQLRPFVPSDRQFVQVNATTRGDGAPPATELCLAVELDGRRPLDGCRSHAEAVPGREDRSLPAVAAPLSPTVDRAHLVWLRRGRANVRWRLSDSVLTELRSQPTFMVSKLQVPETASPGSPMRVSFAVATDGQRGWLPFRLAVVGTDAVVADDLQVFGGERRRPERELPAVFDGDDSLTVRLSWGLGRQTATVRRA